MSETEPAAPDAAAEAAAAEAESAEVPAESAPEEPPAAEAAAEAEGSAEPSAAAAAMLPVDWTGLSAKLPTQPEDATPSAALFAQCDPTGRGMADAACRKEYHTMHITSCVFL